MNENQKIDKIAYTNASPQLPPIFMNNRGTRNITRDIDLPIAPDLPIPAPPGNDYPVVPLPPFQPDFPIPAPPGNDDYPVIPLPPYVPDLPIPAPPGNDYPVIPLPPYVPNYPLPAPPSGSDRVSVNARFLLEYMALYLDGLRTAYPLSVNRPREVREEIKAIRNRAYILYDDATAIVGRMPVALQQNGNSCVGCRATSDALRLSLKNGKLALKRIINLMYLNQNRLIDAELLSLYIRLNEDLKNIQDIL